MKDLNEIMVFSRVAQVGSFSKAANLLGMPVSTVSRKVSDLEERLGMTLITRTTRKLSLTRAGAEYFQRCSDILQGLDEAEAALTQSQSRPEGLIRVTVPVGMGSGRFVDFISDFMRKYDRIQVDLYVTNQFVDLAAENVDVGIRFGVLEDSTLIARKLGHSSRLMIASPSYIKKHGHPKHPNDLKNHECLIFRSRSEETVWELSKDRSKVRVEVNGRIRGTDLQGLRELVIRGHGIALLPDMYLMEAIERGDLVHVLPDWSTPMAPVHAVYPSRKFVPARVDAFLKELQAWEDPDWNLCERKKS